MKILLRTLLCLLLVSFSVYAESKYIPVKGSAWHLELADVNGNGTKELIYATYGGAVRCQNLSDNSIIWEQEFGAFPFDLAAADLDNDGSPEVYVAASDGGLYAYNADGTFRWVFKPNNGAMNAVAVLPGKNGNSGFVICGGFARTIHALSPDGEEIANYDLERVVHMLEVADLQGDGIHEILASGFDIFHKRSKYEVLKLGDNGSIFKLMSLNYPVQSSTSNSTITPFSTCIDDLDGDGSDEMVYGSSFRNKNGVNVGVTGRSGEIWKSGKMPEPGGTGFNRRNMFCMAIVNSGNVLPGQPGKEVVAVVAGGVYLYSAEGKLLGSAHAPIGFTDVETDGSYVYLGSSPNGDNTVYRIDMSKNWIASVYALERRGLAKEIGNNLETVRQQVNNFEREADDEFIYGVRTASGLNGLNARNNSIEDWFYNQFPYPNLKHVHQWGGLRMAMNDKYILNTDGSLKYPLKLSGGYEADEIVHWAAEMESKKIHYDLFIDHGCKPKNTHETLTRILEASPTALRSFVTHEDEQMDKIKTFAGEYIGPLIDICKEHDKGIIMQEKNVWWFAVPSMDEVFDGIFANGRGAAITSGCDNANSRTPELNLMGRFGMKQAGLTGHFQSSAITDLFSWSRMREYEYPKHGHPFFRLMVAETTLGADRFYIRSDNIINDQFDAMCLEGAGLFFHLLGKGVVFTPKPEQMAGISRVGIAVHEPSRKWLEHNSKGHAVDSWEQDEEMDNAVIPHGSVMWGNTPTPEHALQAVLFNKKRQFGAHVPATPYGPVVFVPAQADLSQVPLVKEWWHTDGTNLWREGGAVLTGQAAADALKESFEAAAKELPFRTAGDDVFFHTIQVSEGIYRIFAIDPGWIDPAERKINVKIQVEGPVQIKDLLSDEEIKVTGDSFPLRVPAGSLRILEVQAPNATSVNELPDSRLDFQVYPNLSSNYSD